MRSRALAGKGRPLPHEVTCASLGYLGVADIGNTGSDPSAGLTTNRRAWSWRCAPQGIYAFRSNVVWPFDGRSGQMRILR